MIKIGTKLIKGFIAFVITLCILYSTQIIAYNKNISSPLDRQLKSIDGVSDAIVIKNKNLNSPILIQVSLDNISNLKNTYNNINQTAINTMKDKKYIIDIKDTRTNELEELYNKIELNIHKAIMDGNFPELFFEANNIAKKNDCIAKFYVDKHYVYIHLSKDNYNLYEVEDRQSGNKGGN